MEQRGDAEAAAWEASAAAYIAFQDGDDYNRTLLLDPIMLDLCGDVRGRRVLDLGCGEGRFCRMLGERGARTVGLDLTAAMVRAAATRHTAGAYVRANAELLPLSTGVFDVVVSYITLVDIVGFREAIAEAARVLIPGGRFIVANLSFVTASEGWLRDEDGRRLYHRVDRYLEERPIVLEWEEMRIVNWHRPLADYMQAYLAAGLVLKHFSEPMPDDESLRDDDYFEDWFRVPLNTVMRWDKP